MRCMCGVLPGHGVLALPTIRGCSEHPKQWHDPSDGLGVGKILSVRVRAAGPRGSRSPGPLPATEVDQQELPAPPRMLTEERCRAGR